VTGRVGVCIATSGPGATNLVTGLADAMMDSVPLVAITGQVPRKLIGTDGFQVGGWMGRDGWVDGWREGRTMAEAACFPRAPSCSPQSLRSHPAFSDRTTRSVPSTTSTPNPPKPPQETPIVEVTRAITKHNYLVMDIKDLPRVIKEAFYLAR
jgi:hypothetical protein